MPAPDWTLLVWTPAFEVTALLLGIVVGGFANACIHRLPRGQVIRARDNMPVLGWLLPLGQCRSCRATISWRYPAVEAANGLLWLALAALLGHQPWTFVAMALVTALLVLSLTDLDHQILPDVVTLPGIAAGLAASSLPGSGVTPIGALAAAAGYLAFAAVAKAYERTRGVEGLGQGDGKMAAMLGAFLGWQRMLLVVLLASTGGTLVGLAAIALRGRDMRHAPPFGTFLGAAGVLVVFAGGPMLAWCRSPFIG
jgi:leader peptidase (prepilin peptidase) / N-methyltransferase